MLRLMLDHHPRIAWCAAFQYAVDRLPEEGGWPEMGSYLDWLRNERTFRLANWRIDESLSYPELMDSFLRQKQGGKDVIGAVVHYHADRLLRIWPEARFIHLLRDGRDVARSCIGMGWYGHVWTAADRWIRAERDWERLEELVPEDRRVDLRYEDLIEQPEQELHRICRFLGVPFDGAMLRYNDESTYDRPDPSLKYQWKRKLTDEQVRFVEARIGAMLRERGYELSGQPPIEVPPAMEQRLRRHCRAERRRFRLRRYGFWLLAGEKLTRHLRIEPLRRLFQRRIDAITDRHLK